MWIIGILVKFINTIRRNHVLWCTRTNTVGGTNIKFITYHMMYWKIPNKNILSALYRDDNAYSCKIKFQFHFSYVHLSINILRLPCISSTSFFFVTHILIMYVNNFHKKARREINSVLIMIFYLCAIKMTYLLIHYEQQFSFVFKSSAMENSNSVKTLQLVLTYIYIKNIEISSLLGQIHWVSIDSWLVSFTCSIRYCNTFAVKREYQKLMHTSCWWNAYYMPVKIRIENKIYKSVVVIERKNWACDLWHPNNTSCMHTCYWNAVSHLQFNIIDSNDVKQTNNY